MYSHLKHPGNSVTAVHCEAQEDLSIVDRLLEPQTIAHFLGFALGNPLPNGTQPDASVIRLDFSEVPLLHANFPPNSSGKSIIDRVTTRIGSIEDDARLCLVGKNIHSLKTRLWEGVLPLSDTRWKEKNLDDAVNLNYACHHLTSVVAVFEYLNTPIVRQHLRNTFNLIYDHWVSADTLLNASREKDGLPRVSVAKLWTLYMSTHFEVMAQRAHAWVTAHVDALRAPQLQGLRDHHTPPGLTDPDRLQWRFMDNMHMLMEIGVKADHLIMIPMEGYKGYAELYPERIAAAAALGELGVADHERRGEAYAAHLKARSHQLRDDSRMPWNDDGSGQPERSSGEKFWQLGMHQIEAQNEVRQLMRGVSGPLPREPWISSCLVSMEKAPVDKKFEYGLMIYRLTYGQPEAEWMEFVQKLEAHISDWGDGQTGCHLLKPHLKLCWVDGKENDIAEGDVEAAKRHFNKAKEDSDDKSLRMRSNIFVAIDSASFESYTTKSYRAATSLVLTGDFSGFLLAVDPDFDPKEGIERPDESPGYTGQMRILGSLVWGDLYALFESQSVLLEDLWPLAMDHPNQVYVGPTTPLQVFIWRKQNAARWIILREVVEYAKRKMGMTTSSTSASAPGVPSSSANASTEPQQPARAPQAAETPNPLAAFSDPINRQLRQIMLREFRRHLRQTGADPQAVVMVDEMLDTPPGGPVNVVRLTQRMNADMERRQQQQRDGVNPDDEDETDGGPPECLPQ